VALGDTVPMGSGRKKCTGCNKSKKEAPATTVPFHRNKIHGRNIHIDSSIPSLCIDCGKGAISVNNDVIDGEIIGTLSGKIAAKYEEGARTSSLLKEELATNGMTIICDEKLSQNMKEIVEGTLYPRLFQKGRSDFLKNDLSDAKMTEKKSNNHDDRRWKNIYSSQNNGTDSSINNQFLPIENRLSEILFANEHHASMAVIRGKEGETDGKSIGDGRKIRADEIQKRNQRTEILKTQDLNVLIKGHNLNEAQSLHVDGYGLKLVVIYIDACSDRGYEFSYVKGSHQLLERHEQLAATTRLLTEDVTTIRARKGECIVFFESLVHAGGKASSRVPLNKKEALQAAERYDFFESLAHAGGAASSRVPLNEEAARQPAKRYDGSGMKKFQWFANQSETLPIDVSFQWTFQYTGNLSVCNQPNRTNTWYKKTDQLMKDECCPVCNDKLDPSSTLDDAVIWGVTNMAIHRKCSKEFDDNYPKKRWKTDTSGIEYRNEIIVLRKERKVEKMLEDGCDKFIECICDPNKKIRQKRHR
jgi:hypothetical protein